MTAKRTTKKFKARRVGLSHGKGQGSVRRNGCDKRVTDAINFENLENRQMMSVVNVADFGAKPNDGADDKAAIQAAINAAKPGDTVVFNAGTFNLASQVQLKGGITLTSASGRQDALLDSKFGTSPANGWVNGANFAFKGGDVTGLNVNNLKFKANGGIFNFSNANGASFKNNDFQWGYEGNYYNRHAFYVSGSANGLVINQNYFHDSENADRNLEVWGWANGSYSFNTWYKVNDGGHIMNPGDNFTMEGNVGRLIHRMGIEIQQNFYNPDQSKAPKNLRVINNVFSDWNRPFWDSMGMSIPVAANAYIANNYIRQNAYNGVWGEADSSGAVRGSYGIEGPNGAFQGIIENNTIIGERSVAGISCPGQGTIVRNNKFFGGSFSWGLVGGEPGQAGYGHPISQNNTWDRSYANAPQPPAAPAPNPTPNPNPNPNPTPAPGPNPTPLPTPAGVKVFGRVYSDTIAKLSWTTAIAAKSFRIEVISTRGREHLKTITVNGDIHDLTVTGLHPNWEIDFTVFAIRADGTETASPPLTLHMTHTNPAPTPTPNPNPGPTPLPAPTPDKPRKRYMNHFTAVGVQNALGLPETNMSNGGLAKGDGSPISIAGRDFEKGIGVTAESKLVYNLNGKQKYFASFIGMDDAIESRGTMKFQVWGDGKMLYESDTVNNQSRARKIKVDVQGVKQMWLVVTNSVGQLPATTHADWAQSYLLAA